MRWHRRTTFRVNGATPLFKAAEEGHAEAIRTLPAHHGITVNQATYAGAASSVCCCYGGPFGRDSPSARKNAR